MLWKKGRRGLLMVIYKFIVPGILAFCVMGLGHYFWGRQGLWASFLILLCIICLGLRFLLSKRKFIEAKKISGQDSWGLLRKLDSLLKKENLEAPEVFISERKEPQILISNLSLGGVVIFSEGFLERFSESKEMDVAIAYVISFLKSPLYWHLCVFVGTFYFIFGFTEKIDFVYRKVFAIKERSDRKTFFHSPFSHLTAFVLKIFSKVIVFSNIYYKIDKNTARLIGEERSVAEFLWKMESLSKTLPFPSPYHLSHMFIINPLTFLGLSRYLRIQPNTKLRIKRLVNEYPI